MNYTERQLKMIEIIKKNEPITAELIAEQIGVSRATIRSDLAVLMMTEQIEAKPKVGYFLGEKRRNKNHAFEKFNQLKVKDIQGVPIVIQKTMTVHDAIATLFLEDIGTLIVVDENGELDGIVSRKDLLKVTIGNANAATMPITMVMTRKTKIQTVTEDTTVLEAARKIIHYDIDGLPVVTEDAKIGAIKVTGRITKTNIIKMLLETEE